MSLGDDPPALPQNHRSALLDATEILTDMFVEDLVALGNGKSFEDTNMVGFLPRKYLLRYIPGFAKRFFLCLSMVAWKMVDSRRHYLACVGEELALRALVQTAEGLLEDHGEESDFSLFMDVATKDMDYEFLFEMEMDGIEDSEVGEQMRMVNLHFDDWFKPFPMVESGVPHPYAFRPEGPWFSESEGGDESSEFDSES